MFYAHTRDRGPVAALRKRRAGVVAISLLAAAALALTGCTGGGTGAGPGEVNTIDAGLAGSIDDAVANAMQLSGSSAAIVGVWTSSGEYVHAYGEGINANSQIRAAQENKAALKRIGQPDDIGGVAVFLASKAGNFVCGQCIIADGGVIGAGAE